MMRKGVSPVVATVLLIAIAVISAVAVWYWVAPLTSAQATPSTAQYAFVVTNTYKNSAGNCTTMDLKNSGGTTIPGFTVFEIRSISGGALTWRYVNLTVTNSSYATMPAPLTSGTTLNFNISSMNGSYNVTGPGVSVGSYLLRALGGPSGISGFTDVYFTC